ncbi:MAG: DEAD/DEAH box helicase family protein [Chloroflexaceae bacterium]|nr:DEAD/DEAH box helicase family protein [Chloroflexaceae bacterium]
MTIRRYSSRRDNLARDFLTQRLQHARAYDRIAGYFRSSLLTIVAEALASVQGPIRVVCNSDLDPADVRTAHAAQHALRQEWCASQPELRYTDSKPQLAQLYQLLHAGKLHVRVLPHQSFGLEHGKAGVITTAAGQQIAFMGSVNETRRGWDVNYELLWEDDTPEAVQWVQAEFDYLWAHPTAVPLPDFIIQDIQRLAHRVVIPSVAQWRTAPAPEPAAAVIETPVFRREFGLWEHQKYFIEQAYTAHQRAGGARFVLADMVGLGKTVQLAVAALLMNLHSDAPVLIIAPRTLLEQWCNELRDLLDIPSAYWDGKNWIDERDEKHALSSLRACPRQIGIISQGLVSRNAEVREQLLKLRYACVIVDEAHRARRRNLGKGTERKPPDDNHLLAFLRKLSRTTHSMLLATATPVQLHPIEAWDMLAVLAANSEHVLGDQGSMWRNAEQALRVVNAPAPAWGADGHDFWQWLRNPLPLAAEESDSTTIKLVRSALNMSDDQAVAPVDGDTQLDVSVQHRVQKLSSTYPATFNPFIRHIIRRTRTALEDRINPATNLPYLNRIEVKLDDKALPLSPYLHDAYQLAEQFCALLSASMRNGGFLRTLLLRRVGSSLAAGLKTARKLANGVVDLSEDDDDEEPDNAVQGHRSLTSKEQDTVQSFIDVLEQYPEADPKHTLTHHLLMHEGWLERGCIIFSQYYDTIDALAQFLTAQLPAERIGVYAGGNHTGFIQAGAFTSASREAVKAAVRAGTLRLLLGTDAASEGLNLQRLGSLINLDLPWNPTRLEQRKGRIQRMGQQHDVVWIYNMRYADSVEDRVHHLLSERLATIFALFGQLPDVLEDVWVAVAEGKDDEAQRTLAEASEQHPFQLKYNDAVSSTNWETCATVLDATERRRYLLRGWQDGA